MQASRKLSAKLRKGAYVLAACAIVAQNVKAAVSFSAGWVNPYHGYPGFLSVLLSAGQTSPTDYLYYSAAEVATSVELGGSCWDHGYTVNGNPPGGLIANCYSNAEYYQSGCYHYTRTGAIYALSGGLPDMYYESTCVEVHVTSA